ncbi:helicase-related protein [Candidatus Puniceispirillum sp.]|uniref:helicase-related protein n=1 Tax=Candidatus Puniceispirillum sp. TaxID=2026719 RepID=UPI001ECDCF29|nr:disulfide oxidoreductase [Candidatus Puniceispirillum sp.]
MARSSAENVTLVLGPTNTGKTHLALERMTGYASGIIGFPLRLLARENYDRLVARLGAAKVGLITGEERIIPASARYICATVESMPESLTLSALGDGAAALPDRRFEFVGVDEIQLAGDRERGHVFTDRIMHARGLFETIFMGAETAAPLLRQLLPEAKIDYRQRMSQLSYSGPKKLTRLPRRSAVVAFSAADVYQIAEFVRRQRGGAAVVMGRLSPRTRNAQVELYQNGEVDFLVSTDAIGMGLNLDLSHVSLAADVKYDGRKMRKLTASEMAQIAGRAGRHINDGTFGVTDGCHALEPEMIEAIEQHRFPPLRAFYWRSRDLNFTSVDMLLGSLEAPPPLPFLFRKGDALDHRALLALSGRPEIKDAVSGARQVRLLWEVACVPDFRQSLNENHYEMLASIYLALVEDGVLGTDMVAKAMTQLDRLDGDIDTLMTRLAYIRTWTYITHRSDWTDNPTEWQDRARAIEDRLSDCLHSRLSERFVDKRAAHLSRRLKETKNLMASVKADGTVLVEGENVGQLDGFVFMPTLSEGEEKATILAAARRGLPDEIERRVRAFTGSADLAFKLDEKGNISWRESIVARLVKGDSLYSPRAELLASDLLSIDQTTRLVARLTAFINAHIETVLGRLTVLATPDAAPSMSMSSSAPQETATPASPEPAEPPKPAETADPIETAPPVAPNSTTTEPSEPSEPSEPAALTGAARGIAYMLFERLGSLPTADVGHLTKAMHDADKPRLARLGIRFGVESLYMPEMLKPAPIALRALLWNLDQGFLSSNDFAAAPPAGRVAIDTTQGVDDNFWLAVGYRRLGGRVMRVDMVERVAMLVRTAAREGSFKATEDMLSLAGATREQMGMMLLDLGCVIVGEEASEDPEKPPIQLFERKRKARPQRPSHRGKQTSSDANATAKADGERKHGQSKNAKSQQSRGKPDKGGAKKRSQNPPRNQSQNRRPPEKQADPNSPFAVLANLKLKD